MYNAVVQERLIKVARYQFFRKRKGKVMRKVVRVVLLSVVLIYVFVDKSSGQYVSSLNSKISDLEKENASLKKEIASLKAELENYEKLKKGHEKLYRDFEQLQKDNDFLTRQLKMSDSKSRREKKAQENAKLRLESTKTEMPDISQEGVRKQFSPRGIAYFIAVEEQRPKIIAETEQEIKKTEELVALARSGVWSRENRSTCIVLLKGKRIYKFPSQREKAETFKKHQNELSNLKDKLKKLKADEYPIVPEITLDQLAVGGIGRFEYPSYCTESGNVVQFEVQQVIDEKQMLVRAFGKLIWIQGLSTNGIVDNQHIVLDNIFCINETKTYETAIGGTKTVFVAEPFDVTPYLQEIEEMKEILKNNGTYQQLIEEMGEL